MKSCKVIEGINGVHIYIEKQYQNIYFLSANLTNIVNVTILFTYSL